jgi:hypothetical protein
LYIEGIVFSGINPLVPRWPSLLKAGNFMDKELVGLPGLEELQAANIINPAPAIDKVFLICLLV